MKNGYIAISTFLVLSAVALLVGTTLALLSVFQIQQSLAREKGEAAHALAEGCAADTLLSLVLNPGFLGAEKTTPEGTCTTTVSVSGIDLVLIAEGTVDNRYTRRVRAVLRLDQGITVLSWKDVE